MRFSLQKRDFKEKRNFKKWTNKFSKKIGALNRLSPSSNHHYTPGNGMDFHAYLKLCAVCTAVKGHIIFTLLPRNLT